VSSVSTIVSSGSSASSSSSSSGWSRDMDQSSAVYDNDSDSSVSDDGAGGQQQSDRMQYPFANRLEPSDPSPPLHKLLVLDSDPQVFWFMTQSLLLIMLRNERIYARMMRLDEMARKGSAWSLSGSKGMQDKSKSTSTFQGLAESALDPLATVLTFERKDSGTVLSDVCQLRDP
jgi:hypothetical protein